MILTASFGVLITLLAAIFVAAGWLPSVLKYYFPIALFAITAACFYVHSRWRNAIQAVGEKDGFACTSCGYPFPRELPDKRCPECGYAAGWYGAIRSCWRAWCRTKLGSPARV